MDVLQDYIPSPAYQPRYPRYFSADLRSSKDLNVGPHHAIRLSLTVRNRTNHTNPLQIHNNVADPQYGMFFGNYGRHYLLDFDFSFELKSRTSTRSELGAALRYGSSR